MFIRFRCNLLSLKANEGLWYNIDYYLRLCPLCNTHVEDEYHVLLVCKFYNDLRLAFLPHYYCNYPCMIKFTTLMKTENEKLLLQLGKYVYHCMQLRQSFMKS